MAVMTLTDKFLQFAHVVLLEFSETGELRSIHPAERPFCGWSAENLDQFNLHTHFLEPNHLDPEFFLSRLPREEEAVNFRWKDAGGRLSSPYPTIWQRTSDNGRQSGLQAMIYVPMECQSLGANWLDKKLYYQALHLPGLIHNINGPLGTIFGRAELLNYKHPEISDFEEIIRVGYHLQEILNTFRSKVINEKYLKAIRVNLNRFLDEEISFLNSDLFFKHKVEKVMEFCENIPEFYSKYAALSGIISECYHFFRQFMDEKQEYLFMCRSFKEAERIGFKLEFEGRFLSRGERGASLPVEISGGQDVYLQTIQPSLDTLFLSQCLAENGGILEIQGKANRLVFTYRFKANTDAPAAMFEEEILRLDNPG